MTDPIAPWPGELVRVGTDEVEFFVRGAPAQQDAEPALFVHGLGGSATNWTDLMDLLRRPPADGTAGPALRCEAADLPGFGYSPPPASGDYSIDAMAVAVSDLIAERGYWPVHLVGNSLGGAVCVRIAARRPDLVRTLTLISPALPDLRPRLIPARVMLASTPWLGPWLLGRAQQMSPEDRALMVIGDVYADPGRVHPSRRAEEIAEVVRRDALEYADGALLAAARGLVAEYARHGPRSLWRDAGRVTAPTLVIYGSHDKLVRPAMAARAARAFRRARVVLLPRTGHVAMLERPGLVANEMRGLLAPPQHRAPVTGAGGDPLTVAELLITAPRVIPAGSGNHVLEPGYVGLAGGVITSVAQGPPPRPADIALPGGTLLPGFVDLQVNGYFGVEFQDTDPDGWASVAARLPQTGVTAFLPTFITAPPGALAAALRAASALIPAVRTGARLLGVHAEGPFISPARKGAHNEAWITEPSPAAVDELIEAGQGVLRLVTLAPELNGALAAIDRLTRAGVLVSVGHTDATARQVAQAADHGARMVTHLFNAQRPLHHREPGVPGQALTDDRLVSGLIADLHHVSGPVCVLAFNAACGRICLVTDAAACAGMPPGSYRLGGQEIVLPPGDGEPPVRRDGTLAGSALRMDAAVGNMVASGMGLARAVAAATRVPADLIGRPELGRLAPGAAADLAWLGDDLRASATWVGGELAYSRDPSLPGGTGGEDWGTRPPEGGTG